MRSRAADRPRIVIRALAAALLIWSFTIAAASPLQDGRSPSLVAGGLAGVLALGLLLVQPLLVTGWLVSKPSGRQVHRFVGGALIVLAVAHVGGLWLYSPEDVTDALLLRAPTPFSFWGVIGLGGLVVGALTGAARRRVPAALWTATHFVVASIATTSAAIHAWMIEGAMGPWSKALLCVAIVACLIAAAASVFRVRIDRWRHFKREQVLDKG